MITNKFNLPIPIYNAVNREYEPKENRFSVTDLIGPPLIRQLKLKHWKELTEDASERLWALLGQAVDYIISKHADGAVVQDKFEISVDGTIVVGKMDIWYPEAGKIEDWKVTSVWSFLLGDKPEWEKQLNCYGWGKRKQFIEQRLDNKINKLTINAILRDWQKSKILQDKDYPRIPFISKEIPLWTFEKQEQYIKDQLEYHQMSEPEECSAEDKWEKPTTYAVMKKGKKRALRVLESRELAETWKVDKQGLEPKGSDNLSIVKRPGECIRCENYCPVRFVCPYRKGQKDEKP